MDDKMEVPMTKREKGIPRHGMFDATDDNRLACLTAAVLGKGSIYYVKPPRWDVGVQGYKVMERMMGQKTSSMPVTNMGRKRCK